MSYRNKTYIIFDAGDGKVGDKDMCYYQTMVMWKKNDKIDFNFVDAHSYNNLTNRASEDTIKRKLRERFSNSKQVIVLVGEKTKKNDFYVKWEIEIALKLNLPIIVANLNDERRFDKNRCPVNLNGKNCIHVSFNKNIIKYALDHFPTSFLKKDLDTPNNWSYPDKTYKDLGL